MKNKKRMPEKKDKKKKAKIPPLRVKVDSDGRLAMTAMIRKVLAEQPAVFDPRKYLAPAREALKQMYMHKNIDVLGSAGKA